MSRVALWIKVAHQLDYARLHGAAERRSGAQSLLQVRHRFLVGSGRPSVLRVSRPRYHVMYASARIQFVCALRPPLQAV